MILLIFRGEEEHTCSMLFAFSKFALLVLFELVLNFMIKKKKWGKKSIFNMMKYNQLSNKHVISERFS